MKIDLSTRVVVPSGILFRELGGECVLLNLGSESYFGLDEVGTEMWRVLTGRSALGSALEELLESFDAERGVLERDLIGLAEQLLRHGLLELDTR
ncbi:MAG: PqqD family protein [Myxococcota bacterium]